jgi:hypothetical protein
MNRAAKRKLVLLSVSWFNFQRFRIVPQSFIGFLLSEFIRILSVFQPLWLLRPDWLSRLRPSKEKILTADSATCRQHSLHTPPPLEAYRWKGAIYSRIIFIHTTGLNLPRSTAPLQWTSTHSSTWLVDFGLPYRSTTCGWERETSRSSEYIPSMLEVSLTPGLARWAIELVVIKSYRCHTSADYAQIYGASNT